MQFLWIEFSSALDDIKERVSLATHAMIVVDGSRNANNSESETSLCTIIAASLFDCTLITSLLMSKCVIYKADATLAAASTRFFKSLGNSFRCWLSPLSSTSHSLFSVRHQLQPVEHSLAASSRVAVVCRVGCNLPSLSLSSFQPLLRELRCCPTLVSRANTDPRHAHQLVCHHHCC